MILSSPFARQNKPSWPAPSATSSAATQNGNQQHNHYASNSLRRVAPQHERHTSAAFKSNTLNRLDVLKQRQQRQQRANLNSSALGNYPTSGGNAHRNQAAASNGLVSGSRAHSSLAQSQIYAPASIASPSEYYKRPAVQNRANGLDSSQHYATPSSFAPRASTSASESGRESALGSLFGTLRRRAARWSTRSSARGADYSSARAGGAKANGVGPPPQQPPPPLAKQAIDNLDDEIYSAAGKKRLEAEEIYAEGRRAINGNAVPRPIVEPELLLAAVDSQAANSSTLDEGECRTIVDDASLNQQDFKQLVAGLTNWINDELSDERLIVRNLQEDLFDGQILCKLIEKLHRIKLDIVDVTQNEATQKYKLQSVLNSINRILALQARWARITWTVEGIHSKNLVEIIQLLVTLALYYRAPLKLPENVIVSCLILQKFQGQIVRRTHQVQLTDSRLVKALNGSSFNGGGRAEQRDAFDTLVEFAPDKLALVKESLVRFANRHLNKIQMTCFAELNPSQFSDGLLLVFLISSLEDYFVPLGNLFTTAESVQEKQQPLERRTRGQPLETSLDVVDDKIPFIDSNNNVCNETGQVVMQPTAIEPTSYVNTQPIEKLHNVNFAFQLIEEAGIKIRSHVRPEDIVNGDLKAVLRVLYALFSKYKHV